MYNSYNATLKAPYLLINDHKCFQEHDIQAKTNIRKTWEKWLKKIFQLGFSSEIKVPQLGLTPLGSFTAGARSSRKIPARTHLYQFALSEYTRCEQ